MKSILLVNGLVVAASTQLFAQTGSTVREDRIWNYSIEKCNLDGILVSTTSNPGYHFKGTEEVNGREYMVFRDNNGDAVSFMRQENKKIYAPLSGYEIWPVDYEEEIGRENLPTEILLYDFDAKKGDSYYSLNPVLPHETGGDNIVNVTVTESTTINIEGESYIYQRLSCDIYGNGNEYAYTIVEGVGPSEGYLFSPQGSPIVTGLQTWIKIETVSDTYGNVIFTDSVFDQKTDGVDSITDDDSTGVFADRHPLSYSDGVVTAPGVDIAVYDMTGKRVAYGRNSLPTTGLKPGLYIAKADGNAILKIVANK